MRILLADDQPGVRSALRLLLEQEPGLEVVGEAADAERLLDSAGSAHPDVILLDWELPDRQAPNGGAGGAEHLVAGIHVAFPSAKVIALSGRMEACQAALAGGADAFVSKSEPPERLLAALEAVAPEWQSTQTL